SAARRSLLVDCYSPLPAPETTLKLNNQAPRIKCLPRQRERLSHTRLIHAILLMLPRRRDQFNGSAQRNAISEGKIKVGLNEVRADVEAEKTPALEWELCLRKKVIGKIPGA